MVPTPAPVAPAPVVAPTSLPGASATPKTYQVVEGDDLVTIATRFHTSKTTLMQLNGLTIGDSVPPGTVLRLP